jgi:HK97 gp10 family phage protein
MTVVTVKVDGLRELEAALAEMKKATAKGTAVRALRKAAAPIAEHAQGSAPRRSGKLSESIGVTTKKPRNYDAGNIAYSQTMKDGGSAQAAAAAMRAARKANPATFAEIFITPGAKRGNPLRQAMFQEFGTVNHAPQPFMRPAFDANKMPALETIRTELAVEIEKTRARLAKKAAKAG